MKQTVFWANERMICTHRHHIFSTKLVELAVLCCWVHWGSLTLLALLISAAPRNKSLMHTSRSRDLKTDPRLGSHWTPMVCRREKRAVRAFLPWQIWYRLVSGWAPRWWTPTLPRHPTPEAGREPWSGPFVFKGSQRRESGYRRGSTSVTSKRARPDSSHWLLRWPNASHGQLIQRNLDSVQDHPRVLPLEGTCRMTGSPRSSSKPVWSASIPQSSSTRTRLAPR